MKQLFTKWSNDKQNGEVHQEYPRPMLVRDNFLNLNGEWDFKLSESLEIEKEYTNSINVPFAPETILSGIQTNVRPEQYLHYRKTFALPEQQNQRYILHFGAVDQECIVYLNGVYVGQHSGGYLAFSFDVTEQVKESDNELVVIAKDYTEHKAHARGKQKITKKGKYGSLFYTPTSGIWKTVWLESVPTEYIEAVKITPNYDQSSILLKIQTNTTTSEKAQVKILFQDELVTTELIYTNKDQIISLEDFVAWSPDTPNLYR